jgi:hypothetical protein
MIKEELKNEIKNLKRENERLGRNQTRYNSLQNVLLERLNLTIDEKMELCFEVYGYVQIRKKDDKFLFQTPTPGGFTSFYVDTVQEGVNRLLTKN